MKKKVLTIALAATLLVGSAFSVSAAGVKDVLAVSPRFTWKPSVCRRCEGCAQR